MWEGVTSYNKKRPFQDLRLSLLSNSSHIIIRVTREVFVTENPVYSTLFPNCIHSALNFSVASFDQNCLHSFQTLYGFQKHDTIKNREKIIIFPISFPKLYLRQERDHISAQVQFHGCFKSFNATYRNILKVLLSYIYFNQYLQYEGRGGRQRAQEVRDFTSCDKLLQENKCNNFQNTENMR